MPRRSSTRQTSRKLRSQRRIKRKTRSGSKRLRYKGTFSPMKTGFMPKKIKNNDPGFHEFKREVFLYMYPSWNVQNYGIGPADDGNGPVEDILREIWTGDHDNSIAEFHTRFPDRNAFLRLVKDKVRKESYHSGVINHLNKKVLQQLRKEEKLEYDGEILADMWTEHTRQ